MPVACRGRRAACCVAFCAAVLLACPAQAQIVAQALVTSDNAPVFAQPSETSSVLARLPAGSAIKSVNDRLAFAGPCDVRASWCGVYVDQLKEPWGWMRARDFARSEGIVKFEDRRYQEAVTLLTDEIASHRDPMVVSWLRFYLAYSLAKLDRIDEAIAILSAIARNRALPVAPLAYIAQAKLYMARGDLRSASGPYQALLAAFPGYRLVPTTCVYSGVMPEEVLCRGDPSIAARIESIGTFLTVQANAERTTADRTAPALSKSAAWYELGQAWERTNDVDPCVITEAGLERTKTRRYYEAAVAAAPGSVPAGRAAWKLIDLSRPYEWEGDWKAIVAWLFDKYGGFIAAYPSHELVGEATFNLGVATWAQAGYPELFGYIFTPSGWDDWRLRARQLDPWFITGGFGGGKGELIVQHPEDTPKALQIFQDLLVKHPSTPSAPLARYYSAVILDYCLNDGRRAVVEYEVYLRDYPITDPQLGGYADRARRRIAALR